MSSEDLKNWGICTGFWQSSRETVCRSSISRYFCRRRTGTYLLTAWELHKSMAGDLFGGTAGKRDAQEDRAAGNLEYYVRAMDRSLFRIHIVLNGPSAAQLSASAAAALRMPGGEVVSSFSRGLYSYGRVQREFFPWDVDR